MNDGFYSKNMLFKPGILFDFSDNVLKSSGLSAEDWLGAPEASTIVSSVSNFDKTDLNYRIQNNYERFKNTSINNR